MLTVAEFVRQAAHLLAAKQGHAPESCLGRHRHPYLNNCHAMPPRLRTCRHHGFCSHHESGGGAPVALALPLAREPPAPLSQPPSARALPSPAPSPAGEAGTSTLPCVWVRRSACRPCKFSKTQYLPRLQSRGRALLLDAPRPFPPHPCCAVQQGLLHGVRVGNLRLHRLRGRLPPHRGRLRAGRLPSCQAPRLP